MSVETTSPKPNRTWGVIGVLCLAFGVLFTVLFLRARVDTMSLAELIMAITLFAATAKAFSKVKVPK